MKKPQPPLTVGRLVINQVALFMLLPLFLLTGWFQGGGDLTLGEWMNLNRIPPED